jgi:hypothetical protein
MENVFWEKRLKTATCAVLPEAATVQRVFRTFTFLIIFLSPKPQTLPPTFFVDFCLKMC